MGEICSASICCYKDKDSFQLYLVLLTFFCFSGSYVSKQDAIYSHGVLGRMLRDGDILLHLSHAL